MSASELQSLIKGGSLLSVSRMNRDGGWEKVVAVDNDLSREGGGGKAGFKYDEDGMNRSTQNLIDLKAEGVKSKENLIESKAALIKSKAALIDNQEVMTRIVDVCYFEANNFIQSYDIIILSNPFQR